MVKKEETNRFIRGIKLFFKKPKYKKGDTITFKGITTKILNVEKMYRYQPGIYYKVAATSIKMREDILPYFSEKQVWEPKDFQ